MEYVVKDEQITKKMAFSKKLKRYAITQEHLVFCKTRRYNGYQVWQDFYYDNE